MAKKITIYWRDIPSAVIVQRGRTREKVKLSHRFQEAIDRAAMRAGKGGSDAYIAEWRREATVLDNVTDIAATAKAEADKFESSISDEQLTALIRSHGVAEA